LSKVAREHAGLLQLDDHQRQAVDEADILNYLERQKNVLQQRIREDPDIGASFARLRKDVGRCIRGKPLCSTTTANIARTTRISSRAFPFARKSPWTASPCAPYRAARPQAQASWTDPKTRKISNSIGGTYKHKGDSYTETIEFAFEGMEAYLGKEQKFTAKVDGDKWTHSGVLSEGQKLEEIWKRVR
jgi:hypothetical protein